MTVSYYIPGVGLAGFKDGTSVEDAFKIAGVAPPRAEEKGAAFLPSLKRGVGGMAEGIGSAIQDAAPKTGKAVQDWGRGVVEANPAAYPNLASVHDAGSALGYAGERIAEGGALVAGGLAAGAIGGPVAPVALMAGTMGAQTYGDVREAQRAKGEDNIPAAAGAGVLGGALGIAGGSGRMIRGVFTDAVEDTAKRSLLGAASRGAAEQAAINPTIGAASRAASGDSVTDSEALKSYGEQAASGAVVGGAFGAALHPFSRERTKAPVSDTDQTDLLKQGASAPADTAENSGFAHDAMGYDPYVGLGSDPHDTFSEPPAPQPASPAPLALPHPDKFAPPLYADAQGNVGKTPDLRGERFAAAPEGSQGNLFSINPDTLHEATNARDVGGQAPTPEPVRVSPGQPDILIEHPVASVRVEFGPREILQRLRNGVFYEKGEDGNPQDQRKTFPRKTDSFTLRVANGLAGHLRNDNVFEANRFLTHMDEELQGATLSSKTVDQRLEVLHAAQQTVSDYNNRMTDAFAQEAKMRAPEPGARVDKTVPARSPEEYAAGYRRVQEQKAQEAQATQQRADADARMAQANQTIVDSHRNAIVQSALRDPNETDHAARIADTLKRNGLDPELRQHELDAVRQAEEARGRREQSTEAFSKPDMVEDAGGADNASMESRIPERAQPEPRPAPPREPGTKETNTSRGTYGPKGFRLELQSEEAFQRKEDANKRREARKPQPEPAPAPTPDKRQGEMFTPKTGEVRRAVDNTVNRDPNAPENFKLTRYGPKDVHEPVSEEHPAEPARTVNPRQRAMYDYRLNKKTGRETAHVKPEYDQRPKKVEAAPKPEAKGEQIKREVAERNAPTRQRAKKPVEKADAVEARVEPKSDRAEHSDGGEVRPPAEASDSDRAEQSREVAPESSTEPGESGEVTYESVLREAQRNLASDNGTGLLRPTELKQLTALAQQMKISPQELQDRLNYALDRASERAMAEASGTRIKRRAEFEASAEQPYTDDDVRSASAALQDRLDKLGLHDAGLFVSKGLLQTARGSTLGTYVASRKLLAVAMGSERTMSETLDHEVIHHLVNIGVLAKHEFGSLVLALRRNKAFSDEIDRAYPKLSGASLDEELVAEGFARWANGDKSVFAPRGVFDKIKSFFDAIRSAFTGNGFKTAEDVLRAIDSGEVGSRARGEGVPSDVVKARAAAIEQLPKPLQEPTRHIMDAFSEALRWGVPHAGFTEDIARWMTAAVKSAPTYIHQMKQKIAEGKKYDDRLSDILGRFRALDSKLQGVGGGTANGMIQAIDEAGAWPFEPEWLTKRKDDPLSVTRADSELTAKFDALPEEAQQVVRDVFQTNHEFLTAVRDVVQEMSGDKGLSEFKTLMGIDESQPYNSRRRYGDYVAIAKSKELKAAEAEGNSKEIERLRANGDHYFVQMYDTFHQAQEVVRQLREIKGDDGKPQFHGVLDARETDKATDQIVGARHMMLAFQQLKNLIRDQVPDGNVNQKVLDGVNRLVNDLYLRSLRQSSSRKAEIRRLGVAGGDMDMMRNFITQGRAQAHFIAATRNSGKIFDTIREMRKEAEDSGNPKDMAVYNELVLRHAGGMTYRPDRLANKLKGFTGAWMVASSPSFYIQQLAQPWMISVPLLAGRHGERTALGTLFNAYKEVGRTWGDGVNPMKLGDIGEVDAKHLPAGMLTDGKVNLDRITPADLDKITDRSTREALGLRMAVNELSRRGNIDVGQDLDLGSAESLSGKGVSRLWERLNGALHDVTRKFEAMNRVATGVAAYRLERQKLLAAGKSAADAHAGAVDYAYDVNHATHGSYDGFNAPRYMRGPVGSVAMQFRKFQLMQGTLLVRLAHQWIYAKDPAEQLAARKSLSFLLLHAGLAGGAMGLPGAATAKWLVDNLLTSENEQFDSEQKLREQIGDESWANILLHGVPTLGKHGVDLSNQLGMSTAISMFPYTTGNNEKDLYKSTLAALVGPSIGGLGLQAADALDLMHQWQYYKGLERLLPKGLAGMLQAGREATGGVTNRKGDTLMKPEEVSWAQSFATALGVKTIDASERQRKSRDQGDTVQFYSDRTKRIVREFTEARKAGDTAGMADARERFLELQNAKAKEGLRRSPLSTLVSAAQQQNLRERSTVGGVQYKPRSPGLRAAREAAEAEE